MEEAYSRSDRYIGGQNGSDYTLGNFEDNERSSSSKGKIGLMSITDFGYGSNNASCERNTNLGPQNNACINHNYLFNSSISQWTITPLGGRTYYVWETNAVGSVVTNGESSRIGVRPVLYLESDVKIASGKGTEQEPYRLSM